MGGEKITRIAPKNCGSGLPPRGRGKVPHSLGQGHQVGITPAWAGKSTAKAGIMEPQADHPRVGGEKVLDFMLFCPKPGSPPHGRGKGVSDVLVSEKFRITPAQAGKRSTGPPLTQTTVDHPRVGGEK